MTDAAVGRQDATLRVVRGDDAPKDEPLPGDAAAEDHAASMIGQLERLVSSLQNWNTPGERHNRAAMVAEHATRLVVWLNYFCPCAAAGGLALLGLRFLSRF